MKVEIKNEMELLKEEIHLLKKEKELIELKVKVDDWVEIHEEEIYPNKSEIQIEYKFMELNNEGLKFDVGYGCNEDNILDCTEITITYDELKYRIYHYTDKKVTVGDLDYLITDIIERKMFDYLGFKNYYDYRLK
jgi:hypothetical protein